MTMSFTRPDAISDYAERTMRLVPCLCDLHRMTRLLLAEHVPATGRVLVLGAGGGLDLVALAQMERTWSFDGVDPSPEMLEQARTALGEFMSRVVLHQGYIEDAPLGPFDGATCLLTLHFLEEGERLRTLSALHRRMKPGAPLVVAHHSFPSTDGQAQRWLARHHAYSTVSGRTSAASEQKIEVMKARLPVLAPEVDVALLHTAGFDRVELFYAALTFKGWVGYRSRETHIDGARSHA
jgi:tRNA (cmo5U34)-methyltransferase